MKFIVDKEAFFSGLKIVERATVAKGLQPVLANILIESISSDTLKLTATNFDLTVVTTINAQVEAEGRVTLPAKKLSDIISRLGNAPINFDIDENSMAIITSGKSKFDIIGISAAEFPNVEDEVPTGESIEIEMKPFVTCAKMTNFAAAGYETNNLLSGVICSINDKILEITGDALFSGSIGALTGTFTGEVQAKTGKIGGFVIDANKLDSEIGSLSGTIETISGEDIGESFNSEVFYYIRAEEENSYKKVDSSETPIID